MDPQELVPLEAGLPIIRPPQRRCTLSGRSCYRTPLRLCRLLTLLIILPSMFIMIPLYLRYRVYSGQIYPMSMTDMRLIDSKISPTWCQRQVVRSNATFNAFVVPGPPEMAEELVPVSMTRELELEDDMKEYWGFYLLKGSSVTVSACVSWPGASLIMIKGYKHLQECAYIGDDSSEELDELIEAYKLGLMTNSTLLEKIQELKKIDGKANDPDTMRRHRAGVSFYDANKTANVSALSENVHNADVTDQDPKELREILERLHALRQAVKDEQLKYYHIPSHLMSLPALHRHRDANVDRDERRWLSFEELDGTNSEHINKKETSDTRNTTQDPNVEEINKHNLTTIEDNIVLETTEKYPKANGANVENENKFKTNSSEPELKSTNNTIKHFKEKDATVTPTPSTVQNGKEILESKESIEPVASHVAPEDSRRQENNERKSRLKDRRYNRPNGHNNRLDIPYTKKYETTTTKYENPEQNSEASSQEIFEDVLRRLRALGKRGDRVLRRLHASVGGTPPGEGSHSNTLAAARGSSEELDRLRQVLVEAIDEERTRAQRQQKRRDAREEARARRDLMLRQQELQQLLNQNDEARDLAAEEGLSPDGYAEHHDQVNETTAFDMSNSEFWSSFSSSEEALLECAGLVLYLPLTPHGACRRGAGADDALSASKANALTYRVPANGYYFFVFNSENEVQRNYIRARFDLQKTKYEVARSKLRECTNSTARCDLALDIFSTQKVVLEVPLRNNDSLWNEQFVIISECEPRTSVYMVCVIAVPLLIMIFAFQ
ncbi:uncharacterized protein LOC114249824 [Bombyx mandarina]|uniref:Uncharacterized protein LOC114249824 n=1 Tax=Bombyx mandarina TaxID=7092 RepID=A0A6J2KBM0_BOMMA|nr:uncharacterized protein LOC114249824 [Bombyx mandarina]